MAMAVIDTGYDLLEELAAILLLKLAMVDNVVKELAARDVPGGVTSSMTSGGAGEASQRVGEERAMGMPRVSIGAASGREHQQCC